MIDLKRLNECVEKLNEVMPKDEKFKQEDLFKYIEAVGLLTVISTEAMYLIGDVSKTIGYSPPEPVSEKDKSLDKKVVKVFDKNSN